MTVRPMTILALTLGLGVAALSVATSSWAQAVTPRDVARHAVGSYFEPSYRHVLTQARQLQARTRDLCAAPGSERLSTVRDRFAAVVEAWSQIELVRFGPVLQDNRLERILFWPDRRGIGLRQVQAILAIKDESAAAPASLHAKSVAAQGLVALEYVLFGSDSDELARDANNFRCRYALAIAGNMVGIAESLHADWTAPGGIAAQFTNPSPTNPAYRINQEMLSQIVGVLAHGFEAIRDTRIKPMLGTGPAGAKPREALYWRSGLTVASIRANFVGLRALFEQSDIAELLPASNAAIANSIRFEFRNAERTVSEVRLPLDRALADADQRAKLEYLVILSQSLQKLIGQDLSVALGLSIGFSSADGD